MSMKFVGKYLENISPGLKISENFFPNTGRPSSADISSWMFTLPMKPLHTIRHFQHFSIDAIRELLQCILILLKAQPCAQVISQAKVLRNTRVKYGNFIIV